MNSTCYIATLHIGKQKYCYVMKDNVIIRSTIGNLGVELHNTWQRYWIELG